MPAVHYESMNVCLITVSDINYVECELEEETFENGADEGKSPPLQRSRNPMDLLTKTWCIVGRFCRRNYNALQTASLQNADKF